VRSASALSRGEQVRTVLSAYVSRVIAQSMLRGAIHRVGSSEATFERAGLDTEILTELRRGIVLFVDGEARRTECIARLTELLRAAPSAARPVEVQPSSVVVIVIDNEHAIVDARTRARALAIDLGFRTTEQYKIATAVSELSRNIFRYAGKGDLRFGPADGPRVGMFIVARDEGPGIADLAAVLSETYRSKTGLGRGLQGCKKIMDEFAIETAPGKGTTVRLRKWR